MSEPHAVPAKYGESLGQGMVVCLLCPRRCKLKPGQRGFCYIRMNLDGQLVLTSYGLSSGFCVDPIEKKPLNHFYPGSSVLSFGTAGCNMGCKFCQNWDISKAKSMERLASRATPEQIARAAAAEGCHSVAFTYNDPVIFAEYAMDTALVCRELGIKTVAVTAGYIEGPARGDFFELMDAANVDLKAFTDDFYKRYCHARIEPVLETLEHVANDTECWLEITTLLIPGENDGEGELHAMTEWIAEHLGQDVPLHFSAFHPDFQFQDRRRTPIQTLLQARSIALSKGLRHVFVGNVSDVDASSTYCAQCGKRLIERDWYRIGAYHLTEAGECEFCGAVCAGRFGREKGQWHAGRKPLGFSS